MRTNLPVTGKELMLADDAMIVSKTNLKGQITYINKDFLDVSGFTEAELIGEPHNIVRHPDMPVQAYEDMWATLKAGRPWIGLVKNRCKNGDHYWVEAHATPILENDQVIGYMSVRKKPTREQVAAHESTYRLFREKKQGGLRIELGKARSGGQLLMKIADVSISKKMIMAMALASLVIFMVGIQGLWGMRKAKDGFQTVYEDRVVPMGQLDSIAELVNRNRILIMDQLMYPTPENIKKRGDELRGNVATAAETWKAYMATYLTEEEKVLAADLATVIGQYVSQGLLPAQTLLEEGKLDAARELYKTQISGTNPKVREASEQLFALQKDIAKAEYEAALSRYQASRVLGIALMVFGLLLCAGTALYIIRSFRRPIEEATRFLSDLSQGMAPATMDITRNDELGKLLQVMETWNTRAGFDQAEAKRVSDEMTRIKIALDGAATAVMIADPSRTIIYANTSVKRVLKEAEADIQQVLPSFNADNLIGQNIDQFHKNPKHQADLLGSLTKVHSAELTIGKRRMQVVANPVINDKGERLGSVAEWKDRTEELSALEREAKVSAENLRIKIALDSSSTAMMISNVDRVIVYANAAAFKVMQDAESEMRNKFADFRAQNLVGMKIDGFHRDPARQTAMLDKMSSSHTFDVQVGPRSLRVVANPVINEKGERLGAVAEWTDRTSVIAIEREIDGLVNAASQGDLSRRIDLAGKDGFFLSVSKGLNQLVDNTEAALTATSVVLGRVAQGDLTQTIDVELSGTFGQLKDDTNSTIERLREVIGRIKDATDLINTASKEIAAGNTDLSSRTEEQASSLEETASSMEELNSTVKQNAENANQANTLARSSNDSAVKSGQMVQQIVSTMTGISESSRKIADIIGVIDSIAFQTNILALNAAVEAARAGEQGRGFAVVATEVRNLAQRSATAAKEIKELIAESTTKVDGGTRLVGQAGSSMEAVVMSFQQVTALVTDIANASREQASGIEQVTQAVGQMDEVTQQNAALVEEAAAAAESLEEQALQLANAVSMFKLDANATRNVPGPALRDATPRQLPGKAAPSRMGSTGRKLVPPTASADPGDEWEEF
jgi:methyl-accepting chemotaxis protein